VYNEKSHSDRQSSLYGGQRPLTGIRNVSRDLRGGRAQPARLKVVVMARSSSFPAFLFLFCILCVICGGAYLLFKDNSAPELTLTPSVERVSPGQKFTVTARDAGTGVRSIAVTVRRGTRTQSLLQQDFSDKPQEGSATFALTDLGFKDGAFELEIRAADGSFAGFGRGNSVTKTFSMRLDSSPPRVTVKTVPPYVRRGGTGCIVYSVNKETTKTGVKVGDHFFPGYKQANGEYICFFAFPYFLTVQTYQPELVAVDTAGNRSSSRLPVYRLNREFRTSALVISDNFLAAKAEEFSAMAPGDMTDIERFTKINSEVRKSNQNTLLELAKKSAPTALWAETFSRLPNASTEARFADHRSYIYRGQKQSVEATHLGLDLASVARAPVPAGNSGVVVFTGPLGIYGNMVVIDHGLGLQSLYSHLSVIEVAENQSVKQGDIIGRTGATGMAGGDHLHFGITVAGLVVTPVEWLDGHWIRDNVVNRILSAGGVAPALTNIPATPPQQESVVPQPGGPAKKQVAKPAARPKPGVAKTKTAPKKRR
jgi:murein DD-endopeptidase MepM/ murein hydrolase activator NlpD